MCQIGYKFIFNVYNPSYFILYKDLDYCGNNIVFVITIGITYLFIQKEVFVGQPEPILTCYSTRLTWTKKEANTAFNRLTAYLIKQEFNSGFIFSTVFECNSQVLHVQLNLLESTPIKCMQPNKLLQTFEAKFYNSHHNRFLKHKQFLIHIYSITTPTICIWNRIV